MESLGDERAGHFDFASLSERVPSAAGGCLAAVGGFLAIVGFFLGWVGGFGDSLSGFELARDFDQPLYFCVPCMGVLIVAVGLTSAAASLLRRELPFLRSIVGGALTLLSVFVLCPVFLERDGVRIGWWCAPVGAVLIALGATITLVLPTLLKKDLS